MEVMSIERDRCVNRRGPRLKWQILLSLQSRYVDIRNDSRYADEKSLPMLTSRVLVHAANAMMAAPIFSPTFQGAEGRPFR